MQRSVGTCTFYVPARMNAAFMQAKKQHSLLLRQQNAAKLPRQQRIQAVENLFRSSRIPMIGYISTVRKLIRKQYTRVHNKTVGCWAATHPPRSLPSNKVPMVLEVRGCRGAPRPSVYVPFSFFILVRVSKSLCFWLAVPQILQMYICAQEQILTRYFLCIMSGFFCWDRSPKLQRKRGQVLLGLKIFRKALLWYVVMIESQ